VAEGEVRGVAEEGREGRRMEEEEKVVAEVVVLEVVETSEEEREPPPPDYRLCSLRHKHRTHPRPLYM
jgi:hypothetical protein